MGALREQQAFARQGRGCSDEGSWAGQGLVREKVKLWRMLLFEIARAQAGI